MLLVLLMISWTTNQMMKAFQHFTSSASLQLIKKLNLVPTSTYCKGSIKGRTSTENNLISVALE